MSSIYNTFSIIKTKFMIIKIWAQTSLMVDTFKKNIIEMEISEFVTAEAIKNEELSSFGINESSFPVICIDEESIWFKDVLLQWSELSEKEIIDLLWSLVPTEITGKSCPSSWCGGCSWC